MVDQNKYSVLYTVNLRFVINGVENIAISSGDIVSISIMNQFDTATYPMFRLRLFSDLSILQSLTDNPDNIELRGSFDGGVYRMGGTNNEEPVLVYPTQSIQIALKAYIEFKNTPTSKMDQYVNGLPRTITDELNVNNKVPIEIFGYDDKLIHRMRDQAQAVFKDMTIESVIKAMLSHCNIQKMQLDPIINQKRFDQILIPNLSMIDAFSFFDVTYGLYPKGGMIYGGLDKLYLCDLSSSNHTTPLPIYVHSYQSNSDMSGMMNTQIGYFMQTEFANVSILSESDIERVLNAERIHSVNVNSLDDSVVELQFYKDSSESVHNGLITTVTSDNISPTLLLHKSSNPYVATMTAARINEKITRIDVSGVGFDISVMKPNTRYNLIFESPIRGLNMADAYRASYLNHVLTTVGTNRFIAQSTMTLCRN